MGCLAWTVFFAMLWWLYARWTRNAKLEAESKRAATSVARGAQEVGATFFGSLVGGQMMPKLEPEPVSRMEPEGEHVEQLDEAPGPGTGQLPR